ncbi:MAG: mechanosensitive ion channel [Cyanobacteria bacterium K_Offshore_surface_m2_239]|nr:mechanosensitive ion channel [Cyanobacteria bacterium K_Offshore_surface_m2_239]
MNLLLEQVLGWVGFFSRPIVLEQLLIAGVAVGLLSVVSQRLPSGTPPRLWPPFKPLPLVVAALLLSVLVAAATGRRYGLLLLAWQILTAFWGLRGLERLLLNRWLPPETVHSLVSRLLRPAFALIIALVLLDAVASPRDLASVSLGTWFGSEIQLGTLSLVIVVLYFVVAASIHPATAIGWIAKRTLGISEGSRKAMVTLLRYGFISLGLVWGVARLGINQAGLLAVAGGLSVGLGFGVKEVFSNFISGLWLLVEGSVRPGEVLIHDGEACEVRRLDLRAATLLRASDNAELVVPNQNFFTATTTTYTRSDRTRRCGFEVSAPSSWTPDRMIALLQELAAAHPRVLKQPPPRASLLSFSPSSHSYRLSFSITDPLRAGSITSEVKLALWRRFDAEGLLTPPSGEGGSSAQG